MCMVTCDQSSAFLLSPQSAKNFPSSSKKKSSTTQDLTMLYSDIPFSNNPSIGSSEKRTRTESNFAAKGPNRKLRPENNPKAARAAATGHPGGMAANLLCLEEQSLAGALAKSKAEHSFYSMAASRSRS